MRSGHICRLGAIAGRMACVLAAALLACASLAHAQVIEEGGLPVKGGNNSGEPFSLSCPPRLYVEAGESVLFSCSATAVPEEGVRYEWESVSGDGFHLLSASGELSPLFTAPLSGEGAEYVYRLTAMSAGVYETATVTVIVGGVSGESVSAPVVREECDPFAGTRMRLGEGCQQRNKAPPQAPFGFRPGRRKGSIPWPSFPEGRRPAEEKAFPGLFGAAGPARQAPPSSGLSCGGVSGGAGDGIDRVSRIGCRGGRISGVLMGVCGRHDAGLPGESQVDSRGCAGSVGGGSGGACIRDAGVVPFGRNGRFVTGTD